MSKLPPKTTWAVTDAGLTVYRDGEAVAVIKVASFGRLIYDLASKLRSDIR